MYVIVIVVDLDHTLARARTFVDVHDLSHETSNPRISGTDLEID